MTEIIGNGIDENALHGNSFDGNGLALHETLKLHEMLAFKNLCLTKSATMQGLVTDGRLRDLMQFTAAADRRHIEDLQRLLSGGIVSVTQ